MTNNLLPCPFCSALPELIKRHVSGKTYCYWITCPSCKAETADAYNINDAVKAWNNRG